MTLASVTHRFAWGLLVIADDGASSRIPDSFPPGEAVIATDDTLIVKVRHEAEGNVEVSVWRGAVERDHGDTEVVYEGPLAVPSGVLAVHDVLKETVVRVPGADRTCSLSVHVDDPVEARVVDIVLDEASREYIGFIWIGDEPGIRLSIWARSGTEAKSFVEAEYGKGHVVSLWNEDDAQRPR